MSNIGKGFDFEPIPTTIQDDWRLQIFLALINHPDSKGKLLISVEEDLRATPAVRLDLLGHFVDTAIKISARLRASQGNEIEIDSIKDMINQSLVAEIKKQKQPGGLLS